MALQCLTALCFPSAAEPKAEVTCLSPQAAAELGWSRALHWGRILGTSLIHVLLDKSIRSAWISLLISPVHCHRAPWSWLSCRLGKALGRLAGNWDELDPSTALPRLWAPLGSPHRFGWAGEKQAKRRLFCFPAGKLHHLISNRAWMPWPQIAKAGPPASPTMAQGGFPMYFYSKITSSLKRRCNHFICWHVRPRFSFSCKLQSSK